MTGGIISDFYWNIKGNWNDVLWAVILAIFLMFVSLITARRKSLSLSSHRVQSIVTSVSTLCLKKLKLAVKLSNLNDFQNFWIAGKRIKFATKPIQHSPHLGMLLHYLVKLKI